MGRSPCCEKVGLKKGTWTPEEDQKLLSYIERHGHGSWHALPTKAGKCTLHAPLIGDKCLLIKYLYTFVLNGIRASEMWQELQT